MPFRPALRPGGPKTPKDNVIEFVASPSPVRWRSTASRATRVRFNRSSKKRNQENVERGSGRLVTSERAPARRGWRRCLFELVCAHGPGGHRGGYGAPLGADPFPQELDPVALCRACVSLLADGTDRGRPHRTGCALGCPALGNYQAKGRA